MLTNDGQPFLEVKKVRIARAGKQFYAASEMSARSAKFKDTGKALYAEYRPPEVLLKHLQKFNHVPFVNDHTPTDVTPDNWKQYAVGIVGGSAGVEVVDDEIWLTNDVIFYDRKAYDDYRNGKVELSASYDAKFAFADEPEKAGYDTVLVDIPAVNHVALVDRARAGHSARILDSAAIIDKEIEKIGGTSMKGGFLSFLGIGKTKDGSFKFSAALMDSLVKAKTLDAAGIEKEIDGISVYVAALGSSEAKEVLAGAVADCFKNADAVLAKRDEVSKKIDELYGKCQDADSEAVKRILNSDGAGDSGKDEGEDKEKEQESDKGGKGKNSDAQPPSMDEVINSAVEKAFSKISDSIDAKVDAAMKKALGIDNRTGRVGEPGDGRTDDSAGAGEDASFLVRGIFGNR
jgi:hypothetical protein